MIITYSGRSKPSATRIAEENLSIKLNRGSSGDVNWGRSVANTKLNPDIRNATNKRVMRELFAKNEVPMPKLFPKLLTIDPTFPSSLELDAVVVGRPDNHTGGRGFWKCATIGDVRKALRGTAKKKAATHFMEFVDAPHEYRVHIFKGKSIRISEKLYGSTGSTAHGNYTTIKPTGNVNHVRRAAKKAVEALGLDFGAVDVLATDENCWVLEVNTAPGLGGTTPELYAKVFTEYMAQEC